jgi:hypothetical protein
MRRGVSNPLCGWLSTGQRAGGLLLCVVSRGPMINTGSDDVTWRSTTRFAAGLAVAAVVLSGCSEKQEANSTLPDPSSSAAETTPELPPLGPDDLPMPTEARTQDAAGAEAFVRYYIALINRTSKVMDAEPLRDLSDGCRDCDRIATSTENSARAGNHYEGGEITINEVAPPLLRETTAEMAIGVDQARFVVADPSGSPVDGGSEALADVSGGAALRWDPNRISWLMTDLTFG